MVCVRSPLILRPFRLHPLEINGADTVDRGNQLAGHALSANAAASKSHLNQSEVQRSVDIVERARQTAHWILWVPESGGSLRSDGRACDQLRPVKFTPDFIPVADGSVLIEIGQTRVIC